MGDRQKMTVKVSQENETSWTKDQTGIRVVERIAGNCVKNCTFKFVKEFLAKMVNCWELLTRTISSQAMPVMA